MTSVSSKSTLHKLGIVKTDNSTLLKDMDDVRRRIENGETTSLLIIEFHPGQMFTENFSGEMTIAETLGMLEMVKWRALMRKHHAES